MSRGSTLTGVGQGNGTSIFGTARRLVLGIVAVVLLLPGTAFSVDTLVSRSSTGWLYHKGTTEASDPRSAWREVDYDDVGWSTGQAPVGYPVGSVNKHLDDMSGNYSSFYLRKTFTVSGVVDGDTALRATVTYDDGFIIWINGERVWEENAPDGKPLHSSFASGYVSGTASATNDLPDPDDYLEVGENVVAVQVFNQTIGSGDCLFDLKLESYQKVSDTRFSHDRGFYDSPFTCTITTETLSATIKYTLDCSDPRTSSSGFSSAGSAQVLIDPDSTTGRLINGDVVGGVVLRACAVRDGYEPTDVDSQTYVFIDNVLEQPDTSGGKFWGPTEMDQQVVDAPAYSGMIGDALTSLPTLSIVCDHDDMFDSATGIYANPEYRDDSWIRPTSIEVLYPDQPGDSFQEDCAIRLGGRSDQKKWGTKNSFNLYFRNEYGPTRLRKDIMPGGQAQEYDVIRLRANGNDKWAASTDDANSRPEAQFIRDEFGRQTQRAMGWEAASGTFMHLYINGIYWGVYNPTERPDDGFCEAHFGGDEADYDVMKQGYTLVDGTATAWNDMINFASGNNLADMGNYATMQGHLNIPSFIDYTITGVYGPNLDWSTPTRAVSGNNWRAIRKTRNRTAGDPKWNFFVWDYEVTMKMYADCTVDKDISMTGSIGDLHAELKANLDYKMLFADRLYRLFFNGGVLSASACGARYGAIADQVSDAVVCESARYGDHLSGDLNDPMTRDDDWLPMKNDLLANFFPQRSGNVVQQFRNQGLYPLIEPPEFQHGGSIGAGFSLTMTNPNGEGTLVYKTDGTDPRKSDGTGGEASGAQAYASPIPLTKTTHVQARVRKNNSTWSAVHAVTFNYTAHHPSIRLTEIMYNPLGGRDNEFIELKNVSGQTVGLSEMTFDKGIQYTFAPDAELTAGQIIVLAANSAVFSNQYGFEPFGEYQRSLDNGGERVRLIDTASNTVAEVRYDDRNGWPRKADGDGYSLVYQGSDDAQDDPAKWRRSNLIWGSPGADDGPFYNVLISEALTHSDEAIGEVDTIELYNAGDDSVDIGGWYLSDDDIVLKKYEIPTPTVVPAGGYVVFDETDFNTDTNDPACFALDSHGDEVYVTHWDGTRMRYIDREDFGAAATSIAFGRHVCSDGDSKFAAQSVTNTLGGPNAYPYVGPVVINEVMYHAVDGGLYDYVEIHNRTGTSQDLFDGTNAWKLSGTGYQFPQATTLQPYEYVLVVRTNETAFRAAYTNVPGGVRIFGPMPGALQNNGERIRLRRPGTPDEGVIPWITVDRVGYNDNSPWPESPDGDGQSLERIAPSLFGDDPANWAASLADGGTPGAANSGVLVSRTAGWRYCDTGENLGTGWRAAHGAFDDETWGDGNAPLGYPDTNPLIDTEVEYGDNPAAKHITTYFRTRFALGVSTGDVQNLTLRIRHDDGYVAYLNGQEVARGAMPGGAPAYNTLANTNNGSQGAYAEVDLDAHTDELVTGINVLAVEVHQYSVGSSDLFMDAELTAVLTQPSVDPPSTPTGLAAAAQSASEILLTWTDVADETQYKIRRSLNGTDWYVLSPRYAAANATSLTDTGLDSSTTYYYKIRAENAGGSSDYSTPVNATTPAAPPPTPTGLAASALSETEIRLTWSDVTGETQYKIRRSLDGLDWYALDPRYAAANATSLTDSGLSPNTTYHYKIRATNAAGGSAYSAPVSEKTDRSSTSPFTAYNDLAWTNTQTADNITTYTLNQNGALVDYESGDVLDVTLTVNNGASGPYLSQGVDPAGGTDADQVFGGIVDCAGLLGYTTSELTLTVAGMEPTMRYELVLFGNRGVSGYEGRTTIAILEGAPGFENGSTTGATVQTTSQPDDTTVIGNGNNTANGWVARYERIDPGSDGEVLLRMPAWSGTGDAGRYYVNALMLKATANEGPSTVVKIAKGASWRFRRGWTEASDPATAWRTPAFDDSGWESGATILGYGDPNYTYTTTLSDMYDGYSSVFMRREFTVDDPSDVSQVRLNVLFDDAFILWINGREAVRANIGGAPGEFVAYDAFAASNLSDTTNVFLAGASMPDLRTGTNLVALQVFNRSLTSGDCTIEPELAVVVGSTLAGSEDSDRDGMDDEYETAQFGGLSATLGGPGEDFDLDGVKNIDEYIAGTLANGSNSHFDVQVVPGAGSVIVSFPTVEATGSQYQGLSRFYALEQCAGPGEAPWNIVPGYGDVLGQGQDVVYTNSGGDATLIYRGRVWLAD